MASLAFGVDIGGTNARAALVDIQTGQLIEVEKTPLPGHSVAEVVGAVRGLVEALAARRPADGAHLGVGFAGMLDGHTVVNAPNLGWRGVDFGGELERALSRRVRLVNDLSAAAWGELKAGAAKGVSDSYTVFVGTGVGSAIIAGGRLVTGARGVAGELGHVKVVSEGGRPCGCGEVGCLEAYVGGARLQAWMKETGLAGGVVDLERLAAEGNPEAERLFDLASLHLSLAIANQVTVLNPAVLVLGGGVLLNAPRLFSRVVETVGRRACAAARNGLRIERAQLGDDSGLVGAALLAAAA